MKYFIYAPLQLACMVLCYLTNWVVILFGTEEGQLPGLLNFWNTWDDTLDNKTDIGRMPKLLRYDWDEHYQAYTVQFNGRNVYREKLVKPFSTAEKVKRYFCRCHWLYRNCAYGFAYYWFGEDVFPPIPAPLWLDKPENGYLIYGNRFAYSFNGVTLRGRNPWAFKCTAPIDDRWRWEIYIGWKIQRAELSPHRAMIATRLWIKHR
ncbi:hypothetical protein [Acidaminococcus massiliensis]|uniref:DUF7338 family protein n=1 Tax=Acidaminococcus massiliensis TaxID=1852375 RepID=UPI0022E3126B|nr:hypothetical protein [Acidaminococcus massiliensis]